MDKNGRDKKPSGSYRLPNNKSARKKYSSSKEHTADPSGYKGKDRFGKEENKIKTIADNDYFLYYNGDADDGYSSYYGEHEMHTASSNRSTSSTVNGKKKKGDKGYRKDRNETAEPLPGAVIGRNAVRELLKSGRSIDKIYVKSGVREGSAVVIVAEAVNRKIPVIETTGDKLDLMAGGNNHQGVVALAAEKQYVDIDTILECAKKRGEMPLVVIADGIEDPQNLGSLIRCAECAGAHGIIIPKRRAVGLTPIVSKASAGAIEHMNIAKVSNLADAVEKLKKAGLWIFAAEAGGTPYYETDFKVPAAIVLGSEGFGVARILKEKSDFTVSIPMYGKVNSLNVSTAASVILCHAARAQRATK